MAAASQPGSGSRELDAAACVSKSDTKEGTLNTSAEPLPRETLRRLRAAYQWLKTIDHPGLTGTTTEDIKRIAAKVSAGGSAITAHISQRWVDLHFAKIGLTCPGNPTSVSGSRSSRASGDLDRVICQFHGGQDDNSLYAHTRKIASYAALATIGSVGGAAELTPALFYAQRSNVGDVIQICAALENDSAAVAAQLKRAETGGIDNADDLAERIINGTQLGEIIQPLCRELDRADTYQKLANLIGVSASPITARLRAAADAVDYEAKSLGKLTNQCPSCPAIVLHVHEQAEVTAKGLREVAAKYVELEAFVAIRASAQYRWAIQTLFMIVGDARAGLNDPERFAVPERKPIYRTLEDAVVGDTGAVQIIVSEAEKHAVTITIEELKGLDANARILAVESDTLCTVTAGADERLRCMPPSLRVDMLHIGVITLQFWDRHGVKMRKADIAKNVRMRLKVTIDD
jgi:hypothetical protein